MCLAIPMRLQELHADGTGIAGDEGSGIAVDISLVPHAQQGDYVIVHAGFAIEVLDRAEAETRIRLFDELAAGNVDS